MALSKINSPGQTNETWRGVIDAGINLLNQDILQANTSIIITQSDSQDESTTVCEVTGHTTATFHSGNSGSSTAQGIIQAAINSIPKNLSGHGLTIIFGTTGGQTITISAQIGITSFRGGAVVIKSAKESDNDDDSSTKANTIQSAGTSLTRIFAIYDCSECYISGLNIIQDTGATGDNTQFVIVCSSSWIDIHHCVIKGGGTTDDKYIAILIQRGSRAFVRDSYVGNAWSGVTTANMGIASIASSYSIEPKPRYGCRALNGVILQAGVQISGSVGDKVVGSGGIIVPSDGIIIDETILSESKVINFDNSMSVTDMQNIINIQPKNLNGHTLTFQFADGTYTFGTNQLLWSGFEGGTLLVQGNMSDSDTQNLSVTINGTRGSNSGVFEFYQCYRPYVGRIEFIQNGTNDDTNILEMDHCDAGMIENCLFQNTGTQANDAIDINNSTTRVVGCYFDNLVRNIMSGYNSRVYAQETHTKTGGTDASTAHLFSNLGSIITQDATQAGGASFKATGGVIFNSSGQPIS